MNEPGITEGSFGIHLRQHQSFQVRCGELPAVTGEPAKRYVSVHLGGGAGIDAYVTFWDSASLDALTAALIGDPMRWLSNHPSGRKLVAVEEAPEDAPTDAEYLEAWEREANQTCDGCGDAPSTLHIMGDGVLGDSHLCCDCAGHGPTECWLNDDLAQRGFRHVGKKIRPVSGGPDELDDPRFDHRVEDARLRREGRL